MVTTATQYFEQLYLNAIKQSCMLQAQLDVAIEGNNELVAKHEVYENELKSLTKELNRLERKLKAQAKTI